MSAGGTHSRVTGGWHRLLTAAGAAEDAVAAARVIPAARSWMAVTRDYLSLTKPRIVALLLVTAYCAMVVAAGGAPNAVVAVPALAGLALSAGAAHALNMWYDRDIDQVMSRTRRRPLPSGRIRPGSALAFGVAAEVASLVILGRWVNLTADLLCFVGFMYYFGIYTLWLKRRTPQNIVIGGGAGAVPPLVGWAAATGHVGPTALAMFLIIFLWTPAHFWSLALFRASEYRRAGVPMMPAAQGPAVTKRLMLGYSVLLLAASPLPYWLGADGPAYLVVSLALGALMVACTAALYFEGTPGIAWARHTFRYSVLYLGLLFTALALCVRH